MTATFPRLWARFTRGNRRATRRKKLWLSMKRVWAMTPRRTEYGKKVRKAYEAHQISLMRKEVQVLAPRLDGISGTITTVTKDNLILTIV